MNRSTHLGIRHWWLAILASATIGGPILADDEKPAKDAARKLLDVGWQLSMQARRDADKHYQDLPAAVQADLRLQHAYLLVLLKQRRYTEALKSAEELAAADPRDHLAWRAKVFLLLLMKNYGGGLLDMEKLAAALPRGPEIKEGAESYADIARYLGLMFGYLEHAAGTAVTPAAREAALPKLLARLDEAYREPFAAGRHEVKTQFDTLLNQREDADQKAQREVETMRDEVRQEAATGREQISQKRGTLGEDVDRLREEYDSQMQRLRAEERPLLEQLARIQASAAAAGNELGHLRLDLGRLEALLQKEKDPFQRERLFREIDRLEIQARRYQSQLQEYERAALGVQSRLGEVRQQIARVESETGGRLNRADREFDNLDRQQRQIENAERKAKQATGDKRKSHSLSTRASALTTYAPFPVDEERQKLLQSL